MKFKELKENDVFWLMSAFDGADENDKKVFAAYRKKTVHTPSKVEYRAYAQGVSNTYLVPDGEAEVCLLRCGTGDAGFLGEVGRGTYAIVNRNDPHDMQEVEDCCCSAEAAFRFLSSDDKAVTGPYDSDNMEPASGDDPE